MRQLFATLFTVGPLMLTVIMYYGSAGAASCPTGSEEVKEEREGTTLRVYCKCLPGFTLDVLAGNNCKLVSDVHARLERRLRDAQAGGRAALYSWAELVGATAAAHVADALKRMAFLRTTSSTAFFTNLIQLELSLARVMQGTQDCNYSSHDLHTACQNIRVFQHLVQETRTELEKLPSE